MNIDETTGLPELPEGQWWEVKEQRYCGSFSLAVMTNFTVPENVTPGKHWWNVPVITPEHSEARRLRSDIVSWPGKDGYANNLTKENLLFTAQIIEQEHAKRLETERFLGKYPPNRISI